MGCICFDVDGTLLSIRERYYTLYHDFVVDSGFMPLSKKTYWMQIRAGNSNYKIFQKFYPRSFYDEFIIYRNKKIEQRSLLSMDKPVSGIQQLMCQLVENNLTLIAVSARNKESNLIRQMRANGIEKYFHGIFASGMFEGAEGKIKILKKYRPACIVVDTEIDHTVGLRLGIDTILVSWGYRDNTYLEKLTSGPVVSNCQQLLKKLLKICKIPKVPEKGKHKSD
jgi:phosphoglycolate phosphatase-like HAD superfamily hydrolase